MTIPSHIGQYRILGKIGTGGMGFVFVAEHTLLGRRAAIKTLQPTVSSSHELAERFFNEARATSAISDPGVIQIFDFGYHVDGTAYIVMELLEGETLSERISRSGRLALGDALRIARQLAGSLAAAHARDIVHRDLKPDNIYLVHDAETQGGERTKILDFGICKVGTGESALTQAGAMIGTPMYMSPEQCRGAGEVDHRSDIYALGCLVFHMLTGRPPFIGDAPGDLIVAHLRENAPPASLYVPELPFAIDTILMRCLAKRPGDRFASMIELQDALGEVCAESDAPWPVGMSDIPTMPIAAGLPSTCAAVVERGPGVSNATHPLWPPARSVLPPSMADSLQRQLTPPPPPREQLTPLPWTSKPWRVALTPPPLKPAPRAELTPAPLKSPPRVKLTPPPLKPAPPANLTPPPLKPAPPANLTPPPLKPAPRTELTPPPLKPGALRERFAVTLGSSQLAEPEEATIKRVRPTAAEYTLATSTLGRSRMAEPEEATIKRVRPATAERTRTSSGLGGSRIEDPQEATIKRVRPTTAEPRRATSGLGISRMEDPQEATIKRVRPTTAERRRATRGRRNAGLGVRLWRAALLYIVVLGLLAVLLDDDVATEASPAPAIEARPVVLTPPAPVERSPANAAIELTPPVPVELSPANEAIDLAMRVFAAARELMHTLDGGPGSSPAADGRTPAELQ